MDVSIIIPLYNSELYISRCLNSIIEQPFNGSFEIIVINDCSTDKSLNIVEQYQAKYSNIVIVNHSSNQKVSIARRNGVLKATGKYIWFVDSDDWIEPNSLQCLFNKAEFSQSDILLFNVFRVDSDMSRYSYCDLPIILNKKKKLLPFFRGALWRKFIKRDVISIDYKAFEKSYITGEDYICSFELLANAPKIDVLNKYCYNYFCNDNSITQSVNTKLSLLKNEHIVVEGIVYIINKYTLPLAVIREELLYVRNLFVIRVANNTSSIIKSEADYIKEVLDTLNSELRKYQLNHYQVKYSYIRFVWLLMLLRTGCVKSFFSILKSLFLSKGKSLFYKS